MRLAPEVCVAGLLKRDRSVWGLESGTAAAETSESPASGQGDHLSQDLDEWNIYSKRERERESRASLDQDTKAAAKHGEKGGQGKLEQAARCGQSGNGFFFFSSSSVVGGLPNQNGLGRVGQFF